MGNERKHQKYYWLMIFFLLFFVASPAYGVGYETEPSFIERSVKRKVLFLDVITNYKVFTSENVIMFVL